MNEAGEEGGARMDRANVCPWMVLLGNPAAWGPFLCPPAAFPSGIRDAGTIRFPPFWELKQEKAPQQPPHLFRCKYSLAAKIPLRNVLKQT